MKSLTVLALALAALLTGCAVVPYDPYYNGYGGGPYYSGGVAVAPPVVVGGYYSGGWYDHRGYWHRRWR